ncbi:MAG TPA: TetR/AcrR family transcriptional regulator [Solimonas sp.]|nr:TetR/AcrR family transcriptional regulator [Solimonas sp.]
MDSSVGDAVEPVRDGRYTRHDERRRELMDAAVAYVFREGLSGLSIRPMAEALGISHRTLLHHFGSKEELIARVLAEMRRRQLQELRQRAINEGDDPLAALDAGWKQMSAPERLPFWRAYLEIFAVATKSPERHADFLDGMVKAWLPAMIRSLLSAGVPKARAESVATLVNATSRGLIIDLLTTGDYSRVNKAHQHLRELLAQEIAAGKSKTRKPRS